MLGLRTAWSSVVISTKDLFWSVQLSAHRTMCISRQVVARHGGDIRACHISLIFAPTASQPGPWCHTTHVLSFCICFVLLFFFLLSGPRVVMASAVQMFHWNTSVWTVSYRVAFSNRRLSSYRRRSRPCRLSMGCQSLLGRRLAVLASMMCSLCCRYGWHLSSWKLGSLLRMSCWTTMCCSQVCWTSRGFSAWQSG